jgi:LPS-assembly protein
MFGIAIQLRFILRLGPAGCALVPLIAQAAINTSSVKAPYDNAPMLLQADEIVYDGDNKLVSAAGHVEVDDEGRTLLAERLDYNQSTDKVTASGHVSMTDTRGNVTFADHVVLTDHMREGVLSGFGALIGKNGRLAAVTVQRVGGTIIIGRRTVYSPCKICNRPGQRTPLWRVKAERVVYDQVRHKVHFHDAVIEIKGVPVAYLPAYSVADPTVRYASGLLMPTVGNSSVLGYYTRLPIYIALSSNQ